MDLIEQRLRQLSADPPAVSASASAETLPVVIRRGRLYRAAFAVAVSLGASTVVLGAVIGVPHLVDPSPAPPPVLVDSHDDLESVEVADPIKEDAGEADDKSVDPHAGKADEDDKAGVDEPSSAPDKDDATPATDEKGDHDGGDTSATDSKTPSDSGAKTDTAKPDPKDGGDKTVGDATLSAHQETSELHASPYTNRYWGTATPGERIKVYSDYGWGETHADAHGDWEVVVTFTPPTGSTTFPVVAKLWDHPHVSQQFSLTTTREGVAFTAHQKHDTVTAPYTNQYWGTATPGDTILVWAGEHGEATTTAAKDGSWSVDLHLTGVKAGDTVQVKARNMTSGEAVHFTVTIR